MMRSSSTKGHGETTVMTTKAQAGTKGTKVRTTKACAGTKATEVRTTKACAGTKATEVRTTKACAATKATKALAGTTGTTGGTRKARADLREKIANAAQKKYRGAPEARVRKAGVARGARRVRMISRDSGA